MILPVHEGKKVKDTFLLKDGTLPRPTATDNTKLKIGLTITKCLLKDGKGHNPDSIVGVGGVRRNISWCLSSYDLPPPPRAMDPSSYG